MRMPSTISLATLLLLSTATMDVVPFVHGWSMLPRPSPLRKQMTKLVKAVIVTGGAVITVAGAAGAAVTINNQIHASRGQGGGGRIYNPPSGSMDGKVVVITGGSSGLGLETAKRLAVAGATVVLTSRTEAKGRTAVDEVYAHVVQYGRLPTSTKVYSLVLNLDDLSDVQRFAQRYTSLKLGKQISVVVNNAGVMAIPTKELTVDGYERTFQSNHLGHFVLTSVLFPYFNTKLDEGGTRVITVSSSASNIVGPGGGLDMNNLNGELTYSAWGSYGTSKLANILFTRELQRRADDAQYDWLTATTLHPGVVSTDLWRYIVGEERLSQMKKTMRGGQDNVVESWVRGVTQLLTKTPEQGASTQIYLAATNDTIVKGAFYENMQEKMDMPRFATDDAKARTLWETSERLSGVRFDMNMTDSLEMEVSGGDLGGEDVKFSNVLPRPDVPISDDDFPEESEDE